MDEDEDDSGSGGITMEVAAAVRGRKHEAETATKTTQIIGNALTNLQQESLSLHAIIHTQTDLVARLTGGNMFIRQPRPYDVIDSEGRKSGQRRVSAAEDTIPRQSGDGESQLVPRRVFVVDGEVSVVNDDPLFLREVDGARVHLGSPVVDRLYGDPQNLVRDRVT